MGIKQMKMRAVLNVLIVAVPVAAMFDGARAQEAALPKKLIGMYVHQHWPYNHPYAARTWTIADWRGYADGLKQIGYNSVLIWPVLETMPEPLPPSDRASLQKLQKVIDMLHGEFGMRVYIALCPNVAAIDEEARRATFEKRHFFYSDKRVNPADKAAIEKMIRWREQLFKYLAKAEGVAIIDSDPGGYAGSTNREFVDLLLEHRKMFDRLRPGIELIYWMHVGWAAYGRWYSTGKFSLASDEEFIDTLNMLKAANPEPWGLAGGQRHPYEKAALNERMIGFNYGRIEGEPSFPMTNFGGASAYEGGTAMLLRGVMGNAQTHCVQLPNTFAFARGANGQPVNEDDYVAFADRLIRGQGRTIVDAWKAIGGNDSATMRVAAKQLAALSRQRLSTGDLRGLLFGSPRRFLNDLVLQLRVKAAYSDFVRAVDSGQGVAPALASFIAATERWQRTHGYENMWGFPGMNETLRKLNSPTVNHVLDYIDVTGVWFEKNPGATPFERIRAGFRSVETYTPQMISALKQTLVKLRGGANSEQQ